MGGAGFEPATSASVAVEQIRLKVGRPAGGDSYTTIGESDYEAPVANTLNTYPTRIPVKAGDLIGFAFSGSGPCIEAPVPGYGARFVNADPTVGTTSLFGSEGALRLAIAATLEPDADRDGFGDETQDGCPTQAATHGACSNRFSFGKLKRKRKKGTATLPVTVPGPGTLSLRGKGVVKQRPARAARTSADRPASAAGTVKLLIKAMGKAKRKLNRKGKVLVKVRVTYIPTGGAPNTKTKKVKLIEKRQA